MIATPAWPPRSLPRLYVPPPLDDDVLVALGPEAANYLGNVLRLKEGDELLLFDGQSGEWLARIVEVGKKRMAVACVQQTRPNESAPDLTLAFAPIKKGRIEFLIEKAVELGVARLQPVITQRTIVDKVNLDRTRSHIVEAAEQCGRTSLSTISQPIKLAAFLSGHDPTRRLYFADETGGATVGEALAPGPATILIGPEGGFTTDEAVRIRAVPGCTAIGLGPRILRAETAALAAVALWMSAVGDWR